MCEFPQSPVSYKEATTGPDKRKWKSAMETEMTSLRENNVWDLLKLPQGKKTVGSKWVVYTTYHYRELLSAPEMADQKNLT